MNPIISSIVEKVISVVLKKAHLENQDQTIQEVLKDPEIASLINQAENELLSFTGQFEELPQPAKLIRSLTRPFLTTTFLISTLILVFLGKQVPGMLWTIDTMMAAFWFGERSIVRVMRGKI